MVHWKLILLEYVSGEPAGLQSFLLIARVYPRVCGGTGPSMLGADLDGGLSPRVRGNPGRQLPNGNMARSISTCAGEPHSVLWGTSGPKVYPRVCGGTLDRRESDCRPPGLSPRVRGNPHLHGLGCKVKRSIPACAGEPTATAPSVLPLWVYPRVCGGTAPVPLCKSPGTGLSPRVRGKPNSAGTADWTVAVYPRACGGTVWTATKPSHCRGLSPRVRGNLVSQLPQHRHIGSIPARAGEPS